MGSFFGHKTSGSTYDKPASVPSRVEVTVCHEHVQVSPPVFPNPNPLRFEIIESVQFGKRVCVVRVRYPDCTNYEGVKIMVYRNATVKELLNQRLGIDPHFSQSTRAKSPFARFEPTARGWKEAVKLAQSLS